MKKKERNLAPDIELVRLDMDISLQLQSDANPMGEPDWYSRNQSDVEPINDPMKNQLA